MDLIAFILFVVISLGIIKKSNKAKQIKGLSKRQLEYREYLKSVHWMETKAAAKRRAGYKCQLCGNKKYLQVHHNNYNNIGHEESQDLIVLCKYCHSKYHKKY